jgi:choline dehydrogenase
MNYTRGQPEDYDSWGSSLWTNEALAPVFERIERDLDFGESGRRAGGQVPLRRVPRDEWPPSQRAFLRAAVELGHKELDDLLPNERDGIGPVARNCQNGVRMSMAHCYLNPVRHRANLTVRGDTLVARALVEDRRAIGVEVVDGDGRLTISAREVILAAGGIASPHILTLTGIARRDVLERLGIPVVLELPGVGRNLSDHAVVQVIATLKGGVDHGDVRPLTALRYTAPGSSLAGDMWMLATSGDFSELVAQNPMVSAERSAQVAGSRPLQVCMFCALNRTESVGEIEVLSDDPSQAPMVRFRHLDSEHDLDRLRHAVRHAVELLRTSAFENLIDEIVSPGPEALSTDEHLNQWLRSTVGNFLHGSGTCRMGRSVDRDAVVDERGRVLRIDGLWVMDLSVAPTVVRAPTNATAMAIAEHMAELFRADTCVSRGRMDDT